MQKTIKILFLTILINLLFISKPLPFQAGKSILIFMDDVQTEHLKAYGVTYNSLDNGYQGEWLLNYRGGSFLFPQIDYIENLALLAGVKYALISESDKQQIYNTISKENMERVELTKAPKIAVYTPSEKEPWDDACTLALTYAEIPYEKIWDKEILNNELENYDWLHLHHEDFTGQFGKFYSSYSNQDWYIKMVLEYNNNAREAGFETVQEHKTAVAKAIKKYVSNGGFLFAMCAATDSIDIALACDGIDIVAPEIDNTPIDANIYDNINYGATFAFTNFELITDPYIYEFSSIDVDPMELSEMSTFELFDFSAKIDPIPSMLVQNHKNVLKDFLGQTTAFHKEFVKPHIIILGENSEKNYVKYLYGSHNKGFFTFYSGHDPEDFAHYVNDPPTNLSLYKNSAGYRLILNNVLFPAAKKKEQKT